jgi:phosphoribosyl 1,2-cyclic phosphodiesterase
VKLRFWGVRGSIPAPGPETNRYGGNTSCVSLETSSGLFIIDMGTGLMHLGNALLAREFGKGQGRATILLSHTHWDHIQGLGFFAPVFIGGNQFTVWGPGGSPEVLEDILEGQMDPNFSPLQTLRNFSASFDVKAATAEFAVGDVIVRAKEHPHGQTTALAFRIEDAGKVFVYASDVGYVDGFDNLLELYRGADVLLHDTTYRPADQATRRDRGFSSYEEACEAAIAAGAKRLVTFHYDQDYTDDDVDEIVAACEAKLAPHGIAVTPAREGDELTVA